MVQQIPSTASHPPLSDAILPWTPERSSLGNDPCRFHGCDHLKPELLIAIKDQIFVRCFKWKRFAQLLNDPTARRMLRDVNVQDAPAIVTDDEEAVEHAKRDRWHSEEIHGRNRFPMVSKKGQPALGPVRISRRSFHPTGDRSLGKFKTEHAKFPMYPRRSLGFSATIRKISSRTSFRVCLLPTWLRTLEISREYMRKPLRCQRTTVSGVTMMRDSFQADHTRRVPTQKSLSKSPRRGRGCRRFIATSC
jgi:hypothetical protein